MGFLPVWRWEAGRGDGQVWGGITTLLRAQIILLHDIKKSPVSLWTAMRTVRTI